MAIEIDKEETTAKDLFNRYLAIIENTQGIHQNLTSKEDYPVRAEGLLDRYKLYREAFGQITRIAVESGAQLDNKDKQRPR